MSKDEPKKKPYYKGSVFFPIILIVIGIVLLLNNLGKLSDSAWETFLLCWPFMFIVIGLDSLLHRDGAAVPTFFIGLGMVLLLSNFDQIAWSPWDVVLVIWPVFLVAIGLDIIFGRRSFWMGLLAGFLIIALFMGIFLYFESDLVGEMLDVDSIEQTISGANQAEILIQPLISNLSLVDLDDSNNLLEGTIRHLQGEKIQQTYQVQDDQGLFTLESSGGTIIFPAIPGSDPTWDLDLTTSIPLDLVVKMVIGKMTIEAQNLDLSRLSTSVVIGETSVFLPERGVFTAKIESVMGSITIYVPDSMEVRINNDVGLLNIQLPEDYLSREDSYFSPGYAGAENKVDLEVSQVLGKVEVVKK